MIIKAAGVLLLMWTALAWIRFCLDQLNRYPTRVLNREAWAFLIVFTVPLGGIAYFVIERGWRPS